MSPPGGCWSLSGALEPGGAQEGGTMLLSHAAHPNSCGSLLVQRCLSATPQAAPSRCAAPWENASRDSAGSHPGMAAKDDSFILSPEHKAFCSWLDLKTGAENARKKC